MEDQFTPYKPAWIRQPDGTETADPDAHAFNMRLHRKILKAGVIGYVAGMSMNKEDSTKTIQEIGLWTCTS